MKKRFALFINILVLILCSCSTENNNTSYPEYFLPIIEELESSHDVYAQTIAPAISTWWDTGVAGGGKYADTELTCYINGESYSFDCNNPLPNADEWDAEVIGIFPDETTNKTFVFFHHFVTTFETTNNPTLILLEFTTNNPSEYTITPYEASGALNWLHICYRIENYVYIAAADNIFASINLGTHEIAYREKEYNFTNDLVLQHYAQTNYQMCQFRATLQQNNVIVYSAFISEAYDITPVGLISVAYEDGQPIAYMIVDLTDEDLRKDLIIESIK